MKEKIEDEVITLADSKTANNLRGAASIGISETNCGHTDAQCAYDSDCCYCKFIYLKLETQ
jgi:hypothetical protein